MGSPYFSVYTLSFPKFIAYFDQYGVEALHENVPGSFSLVYIAPTGELEAHVYF